MDPSYQSRGVGRELLERVKELVPGVLMSGFYARVKESNRGERGAHEHGVGEGGGKSH